MTTDDDVPPGMLRKVVTFLEMTQKPEHRVVHRAPAEKLALLRAEQPTVSFYRYLYDTVGLRWLWTDRRKLSDAALLDIIANPKVEIYVLYKAGVPAGFVELNRNKPDSAVDLAYFGLVPEFMGQGLGPWLLTWAVDAAWTGGARKLTVNTCNFDHPRAVVYYQRAGFAPVGQKVEIVPDPRLEGLVPMDAAPHIPIGRG